MPRRARLPKENSTIISGTDQSSRKTTHATRKRRRRWSRRCGGSARCCRCPPPCRGWRGPVPSGCRTVRVVLTLGLPPAAARRPRGAARGSTLAVAGAAQGAEHRHRVGAGGEHASQVARVDAADRDQRLAGGRARPPRRSSRPTTGSGCALLGVGKTGPTAMTSTSGSAAAPASSLRVVGREADPAARRRRHAARARPAAGRSGRGGRRPTGNSAATSARSSIQSAAPLPARRRRGRRQAWRRQLARPASRAWRGAGSSRRPAPAIAATAAAALGPRAAECGGVGDGVDAGTSRRSLGAGAQAPPPAPRIAPGPPAAARPPPFWPAARSGARRSPP